jgi:hypothetical protein
MPRILLPPTVSGRYITNRGVHLLPFAHHGFWMGKVWEWMDLLISMDISWVVIINDGDSVLQEVTVQVPGGTRRISPIRALLEAGVIPLIRDSQKFPRIFTSMATVEQTVAIYDEFGLRPFWILYNEPFDSREWIHEKVPPYEDAWNIIVDCWTRSARLVAGCGAYVGFPDGPGYSENPFERIRGAKDLFDAGLAYYTVHCYGKGRPEGYPYDPVTQTGEPLTEAGYRAALDDYWGDPQWQEEPLATLNARRAALAHPGLTALQDDTCWRGWEKVVYWSQEAFGYVVPMALTEGGWVPRDRAGSGSDIDNRWPHTTPNMVGKKTLQMFDVPSPLFAICPWLLGDDSMIPGGVGWYYDAWTGWAFADQYGFHKPVVKMLQDNPDGITVYGLVRGAHTDLGQALALLEQIGE